MGLVAVVGDIRPTFLVTTKLRPLSHMLQLLLVTVLGPLLPMGALESVSVVYSSLPGTWET